MIRKISVGIDLKNAMHFSIGQSFNGYVVESIIIDENSQYKLFVRRGGEIYLWKVFNQNVPVTVEFDLSF